MQPLRYQSYASPSGYRSRQPAWSPPFLAGSSIADAGDSDSGIQLGMRSENVTYSSLPNPPEALLGASHRERCQEQFPTNSGSAASMSFGNIQASSFPPHPVFETGPEATSYHDFSPGGSKPYHSSAFPDDLFWDITQHDYGLGSCESDYALLDDGSTTLDNWTSPNTFIDPVTPSQKGQSSWPAPNTKENNLGGQPLATYDFQSPQLGHDLDLFGIGSNYISPQQMNLDAPRPDYPPLPELEEPFEYPAPMPGALPIASSSPYLPAWPLAEDVPTWLEHEPGGQTLWDADITTTTTQNASTTTGRPFLVRGALRDTSKDEYLVRCKEQGMSYKQIKESGGFDEAESTLRGRYRALTKPREARLRKPEWGQREIDLLFEGVAHCSKSSTGNLLPGTGVDAATISQFVNKVPWKQVAEYMENRGAYRYGNATVKKKYLEVLKARGISVPLD
ncbi:hypothetical protein A1O1_05303 [Capronia coronata CBS 617.96]|uniref:Myb-like domain-containing protein n=1 Tax=Capronia coronata CBS 617.96 TaxID=1182541 RepID=W9Y793_9EURO|nr:uncharacterized protein A1O1_05303 [Capronia coronata CBS 617.96]EXJ88373.1 hypothetical protein A1O1_05303 [Capronia coronata CBS 617.96]